MKPAKVIPYSKADFLAHFRKAVENFKFCFANRGTNASMAQAKVVLQSYNDHFTRKCEVTYLLPISLITMVSQVFEGFIDECKESALSAEKLEILEELENDIDNFFDIYLEDALIAKSAEGQTIFEKPQDAQELERCEAITQIAIEYVKGVEKNPGSVIYCGVWGWFMPGILELPQLMYYPGNAIELLRIAAKTAVDEEVSETSFMIALRDLHLFSSNDVMRKYGFRYSILNPKWRSNVSDKERQSIADYLTGLADLIEKTALLKASSQVPANLKELHGILGANLLSLAAFMQHGEEEFPSTYKNFLGVVEGLRENGFGKLRANILALQSIENSTEFTKPSPEELGQCADLARKICALASPEMPKGAGFRGTDKARIRGILDYRFALPDIGKKERLAALMRADYNGPHFEEINGIKAECPELFAEVIEDIKIEDALKTLKAAISLKRKSGISGNRQPFKKEGDDKPRTDWKRFGVSCLIGASAMCLPYASTFVYKWQAPLSPKVMLASSLLLGIIVGICAYRYQEKGCDKSQDATL